jgi:hypothetical protein
MDSQMRFRIEDAGTQAGSAAAGAGVGWGAVGRLYTNCYYR